MDNPCNAQVSFKLRDTPAMWTHLKTDRCHPPVMCTAEQGARMRTPGKTCYTHNRKSTFSLISWRARMHKEHPCVLVSQDFSGLSDPGLLAPINHLDDGILGVGLQEGSSPAPTSDPGPAVRSITRRYQQVLSLLLIQGDPPSLLLTFWNPTFNLGSELVQCFVLLPKHWVFGKFWKKIAFLPHCLWHSCQNFWWKWLVVISCGCLHARTSKMVKPKYGSFNDRNRSSEMFFISFQISDWKMYLFQLSVCCG